MLLIFWNFTTTITILISNKSGGITLLLSIFERRCKIRTFISKSSVIWSLNTRVECHTVGDLLLFRSFEMSLKKECETSWLCSLWTLKVFILFFSLRCYFYSKIICYNKKSIENRKLDRLFLPVIMMLLDSWY